MAPGTPGHGTSDCGQTENETERGGAGRKSAPGVSSPGREDDVVSDFQAPRQQVQGVLRAYRLRAPSQDECGKAAVWVLI